MDFWHQVLSIIEKAVSRQCFDTWFRPVVFQAFENGILHLTVPTESFKKCLLDNYSALLQGAAREISKSVQDIDISSASVSVQEPVSSAKQPAYSSMDSPPLLNSRYTFDTFVVGTSNQLARAAALAVAERPSKAYNPLYLYGGVGLGKTHLMHAIGNLIQKRSKSIRLTYMSSEKFMNELVNAIRFDRTIQFRQKYRNIDVLLMDDIQFIAGKERTQEEFFHTFNALYDAQKQIVITSDCPPKQIPTLEERLHSRFEWGLIADIQPPDLETKLAILRKKAESELLNLKDEVAMYIAGGIRSNIRELEGALNRLSARASLDGLDVADIDVAYAKEVLKGFTTEENSAISPQMVLRAVASYYSLKPAQLKAKNNSRPIAVPRQIAMYICKELTKQSLPQIGKEFGGKHHTTVLHSIRKIDTLRKKDSEISSAVNSIVKTLR
ncbi:MAG: chromosomal replication initiator protein DnaA [Acidobacteria bacterium]|nr:chromosomal replication initiator protein DnaA [Acidobacteriota bacterium]